MRFGFKPALVGGCEPKWSDPRSYELRVAMSAKQPTLQASLRRRNPLDPAIGACSEVGP